MTYLFSVQFRIQKYRIQYFYCRGFQHGFVLRLLYFYEKTHYIQPISLSLGKAILIRTCIRTPYIDLLIISCKEHNYDACIIIYIRIDTSDGSVNCSAPFEKGLMCGSP